MRLRDQVKSLMCLKYLLPCLCLAYITSDCNIKVLFVSENLPPTPTENAFPLSGGDIFHRGCPVQSLTFYVMLMIYLM